MQQKIIRVVNYLNLFASLWLVVRSLFWNVVPAWFLYGPFYLFFITYTAEVFLEQRWRRVKLDAITIYFGLFVLFFVLGLFYLPFDSSKYLKHHLENRYALLGFGVVGVFGLNQYYKMSYLFKTMIVTSVVAILFLFFKVGIAEFILSPNRNLLFTQARIENVNAHMGFNLFLNVSLVGIWYICSSSWRRIPRYTRYLYVLAMCIIFFVLSISEGRSGFLASIFLLFSFLAIEVWRRRKILGFVMALVLPLALAFAASQHTRIAHHAVGDEPRIAFWHSAVELIEKKPILGYGISNAQVAFDQVNMKYTTLEYRKYWTKQGIWFIDTHNQYIQTTLEFGVVGLLLLLLIYFAPIGIVESKRRLLCLYLCGLCAYQSVFDMFITGQFCLFFCLLMLAVLRTKNDIVLDKSSRLVKKR